MATKLYLHNASNSLPGTFPSSEQGTGTADWSVTGANTLKTMNTTIGSSMTSMSGTGSSTTLNQNAFLGFFCSPPLDGNQTINNTTTVILNVADAESNTNMNFFVGAWNLYVWRPSTGAVVGTVRDFSGTVIGGTEATSANSIQVTHLSTSGAGITTVNALDGDVIILELWARFAQSMASSYTATVYYDGTTENATENTVVTNHASYLQLTEDLIFKAPAAANPGMMAMFM